MVLYNKSQMSQNNDVLIDYNVLYCISYFEMWISVNDSGYIDLKLTSFVRKAVFLAM